MERLRDEMHPCTCTSKPQSFLARISSTRAFLWSLPPLAISRSVRVPMRMSVCRQRIAGKRPYRNARRAHLVDSLVASSDGLFVRT